MAMGWVAVRNLHLARESTPAEVFYSCSRVLHDRTKCHRLFWGATSVSTSVGRTSRTRGRRHLSINRNAFIWILVPWRDHGSQAP